MQFITHLEYFLKGTLDAVDLAYDWWEERRSWEIGYNDQCLAQCIWS